MTEIPLKVERGMDVLRERVPVQRFWTFFEAKNARDR